MDDVETRTVLTLRTGTKICVLVGLAFIVLAIYFFVVPITSVRTTTGAVFGCGTAMSPSHGSFADGVCWRIADANRYRAIAALAIGLVTIIAGGVMFGVDRREEQRRVPRDHHDVDAVEPDAQRRDRDWADDPRSDRDPEDQDRRSHRDRSSAGRRDELGDSHDDHHDWDDDRSRQDDHRRYDDRDDRRSRRRETDDRRDDRDDDRYASRRGPDQR